MVDFELDAAQDAWLAEVRAFLTENVTPALRSELAELQRVQKARRCL